MSAFPSELPLSMSRARLTRPEGLRVHQRYPNADSPVSRYWEYLLGLTLSLLVLHTLIRPTATSSYTSIIGYLGLAIEAVLPLPQIFSNQRAHSCKGFRLSVLVNWLLGDALKMGFFFMSEPGKVPWAFKMCGIFQACCDVGLGAQYWVFGEGQQDTARKNGSAKEGRLT